MVFTSTVFLFLFLPFVLVVYYLAGHKQQNFFLLFASLFFYAWGETFYVGIMLVSITANYFLGLYIHKFRQTSRAKILLGFGILINLGILCWFKYSGFLVQNLNLILPDIGVKPIALGSVHLPIGISFFTFQALTYIVDVYRGIVPAQRNPINIALYIALFPQLIAGPIVRYHDIASQINERQNSLENFSEGVRRFIIGMGKKMLIANPMGEVADQIFALPGDQLSASVAWLGITCYTLQIYFDFSGYSDMAIGLGRMFGFKFLENFRYPYISKSVQEFWRRWHISLSSWFKDYLYIPLGGNRGSPIRTYFNLFTVFFLCGLWHGASWNFILWGMIHGLFLVIERIGLGKLLEHLWTPLRHIYLLFVIMVGWVFFKLDTFPEALEYLKAMAGFFPSANNQYHIGLFLDLEKEIILLFGILCSTPLLNCMSSNESGTKLANF
jgi:alginate O-acetyltransferase complex protein AlgI